jgi:hypothetical protein
LSKQIFTSEQFEKLLPKAQECRVVRGTQEEDCVKLKLRTPEYLYVYKTTEEEAQSLIKKLKDVQLLEYGRAPAKDKSPSSSKKSSKSGGE